ncbi:DUF4238 domain-containing protein [Blastococcus sp. SYSU D00669]
MADKLKTHQHTVPRTLLRGFCDEREFVTMRRRDGLVREIPISNATVRRRFYTFDDSSGQPSNAVEDWLSEQVESRAGPVLQRLREGQQPTPEDRPALARLAVAGLLRTATVASYLEQMDRHLGPFLLVHGVFVRHEVDPASLSPTDIELLQAAATDAWQRVTRDDPAARLRTMVRKFDELVLEVTDWVWSLQVSPDKVLITSDAPVVTFTPASAGWHGVLPSGSPLMLPVSPRHLLYAEKHPLPGVSDCSLDAPLAKVVNEVLAREADDAVFTHPAMDWPLDLVLAPTPPTLPTPTVTWGRPTSAAEPRTFPATYPPVQDASVRAVLRELGAEDEVQ